MSADKSKKPDEKTSAPDQENPLYLNSAKNFKPTKYEDYGSFFYPERTSNPNESSSNKPNWYDKFISYDASRELIQKNLCEQNVKACIEKHPGVKLLLSAMKSVGCEASLMRHFSCEKCDKAIKGGFDPSTNQIFLCHDRIYEYKDIAEILSHELVHAFDYCRANIDIENNRHVACSEIRAANLTSCTLWDAFKNDSALFNIKNAHKECVRRKAALSLQMVRNVSELEAYRVVDEVFDKCYNDLEPFGRRVLNEKDCERAYEDRRKFGYE